MNTQTTTAQPEVKVTKGFLFLNKITAAVKTVFGEYDISENKLGEGMAMFEYDSRKSHLTMDVLAFELENLAEEIGITVDRELDASEQIPLVLKSISTKMGSFDEALYHTVLKQLNSDIPVYALFNMAKLLDDGHGLSACYEVVKSIMQNGECYGDESETYISKHLHFDRGAELMSMIGKIDQTLSEGEVETAIELFAWYINAFIDSILDESIRNHIKEQIIVPARIDNLDDDISEDTEEDIPESNVNHGSEAKYYIGTLLQQRGEKERRLSVRFMTDGCPISYLEEIASRYGSDDNEAVEKEDGGYYFECGEIHLKPHVVKEVPKQFYLDCAKYNAVEFVSI